MELVEKSEAKFVAFIKRFFNAKMYIHKMADFKMLGESSQRGVPDYLIIYKSHTLWFEVKKVSTKKGFNFNNIRESQWIEFRKMSDAGAKIFFAILINKKFKLVDFKTIYDLKFVFMAELLKISDLDAISKRSELMLNVYKNC